jgi:hypothetical protein
VAESDQLALMSWKSIRTYCEGQQTRLPKKKFHWRCIIFRRNCAALEVSMVVYVPVRTNMAFAKKARAALDARQKLLSRLLFRSALAVKKSIFIVSVGKQGLRSLLPFIHSDMGVEGMLSVRTDRRKFSIAVPGYGVFSTQEQGEQFILATNNHNKQTSHSTCKSSGCIKPARLSTALSSKQPRWSHRLAYIGAGRKDSRSTVSHSKK